MPQILHTLTAFAYNVCSKRYGTPLKEKWGIAPDHGPRLGDYLVHHSSHSKELSPVELSPQTPVAASDQAIAAHPPPPPSPGDENMCRRCGTLVFAEGAHFLNPECDFYNPPGWLGHGFHLDVDYPPNLP